VAEFPSLEEQVQAVRAQLKPNSRVVFLSGDFNVIHPGHLRIINFAATCGDFLVIGVSGDGLGNSLVPEQMRRESVAALGVVDHALILKHRPEEFIALLKPHIVVKGHEHSRLNNPEKSVLEGYGGKLLFCSGDVRFSSQDLLRRELYEANLSSIRKPQDYPQRYGFDTRQLTDLVDSFTGMKVVVIGDLIVDEYIDCDPLGMSREDPTLVVMPILAEKFVGGAGIVAAHASGLGASVSYFGVGGNDAAAQFALEKLQGYGVACTLLNDSTRPTTLKQRYRASNKTLLRVSHLRQNDISNEIAAQMFDQMRPALDDAQLLIFSDFNYGCLPQILVDRITEYCRAKSIPMVADSQSSSQIGDISRFKGVSLVTPTEHEARVAMRDSQSGLVYLAESLSEKSKVDYVIVTLGAEGILIHWRDCPTGIITDQLPAFNHAPKDVSGAGDCLLTCTAMALTKGANIWLSAYLGSVAAACQVSRVGNTPLTAAELIMELKL